jgi:hypothetical protein
MKDSGKADGRHLFFFGEIQKKGFCLSVIFFTTYALE